MKKKLLSLISTVLCLCVVLSACGGPANSDPSSSASESQSGDNTQDKTLTIATMTETTTLSPLYMGVYNYSMCTMLYETLLKYEDGEVKGNLAESYSFNEDGTVMTLTLRQDAQQPSVYGLPRYLRYRERGSHRRVHRHYHLSAPLLRLCL